MPTDPPSMSSDAVPRWPDLHPTTQKAFNHILWNHGLPRTEIARKLGVSRTRLTAITRDLEAAGLVVPGGHEQRSVTGRPAEMIVARYDAYHFLGVHLDGVQAVGSVVDMDGAVVWQQRADVATTTPEDALPICRRWYRAALRRGLRVVGLAICGPWNRFGENGVPPLVDEGRPLASRPHLPIPVWVEDDVVALTALEQWPRLAEGQDSMVLVSVGEEVAFSVVTDRKIVLGAHNRAGRFGHVPVSDDDVRCLRGHRGCLWSTTASPAILASVPGAQSVAEVAERAAAGDGVAEAALRRAAAGLGVAAGYVVNLLDPDKLLLVGDARPVLRGQEEALRSVLATVTSSEVSVEIDVPALDVVEWARAAASLALYRTFTSQL